ncbi:Alpha/Beta hydrolase protein [Mycena floridula]|nr:Alpha/Beta hydrolase protein [Mycena floridula]
MPVNTLSAATHITPVVLQTFLSHGKQKAKKYRDGEPEEATDNIVFDESFHIVKAFIELGTKNTVESLQGFTNTHVASIPPAAVCPVRIPLSTCNSAADILISWFSPEELKLVVGGERWWQVRGLDGIDAEWVTEKEYLSDSIPDKSLAANETTIRRMECLDKVMLYVHGGAFFWGSINTHRYQIVRYARKAKCRAFAVNYRKAPQYPFPCGLVDVLAAYLYLIQPPKNSVHSAVDPSQIVLAGDSAGASLALVCLTVLRDLGLPMPAGAVLISPWVDLTHSFPSVVENTATDIVPPHGFLAKPSTIWPIDLLPPDGGRVATSTTNAPPKPGHADPLQPDKKRLLEPEANPPKSQQEMLAESASPVSTGSDVDLEAEIEKWEPKPPKVLMDDPTKVPLELRSQIQLYATNEQLTHPLVSPILQGSLGGLPPLYIIAGDGEVLRDEIIYLAHRAAYPHDYPVRRGALRDPRQARNAEEYNKQPTKVHLQVFDGMPHVLTVFTFTRPAKYAYRSIAEFIRHVTRSDSEILNLNAPFPELQRPPSQVSTDDEPEETDQPTLFSRFSFRTKTENSHTKDEASDVVLYKEERSAALAQIDSSQSTDEHGDEQPDGAATMISQRIDIHGRTRAMEPQSEIAVLKIPREQVGLIKEAPALRWASGQAEWDETFRGLAEKMIKARQKLEAKAQKILDNARNQGLLLSHEVTTLASTQRDIRHGKSTSEELVDGSIQEDRRWGPLDLDAEKPPPSAIAKRRDNPESLALLKKTIYHTAPSTHRTIPRLKASDAIRAAFDPHDDPGNKPPQQSASEQQVRVHFMPFHGLDIWDGLVRYFMRESSKTKEAVVKKTPGST